MSKTLKVDNGDWLVNAAGRFSYIENREKLSQDVANHLLQFYNEDLGYGSFMIYRNPVKQGIFVSALCLGTLLVGLGLLYDPIFNWDCSFELLEQVIPAVIMLIISLLFWISLRKSKEILW